MPLRAVWAKAENIGLLQTWTWFLSYRWPVSSNGCRTFSPWTCSPRTSPLIGGTPDVSPYTVTWKSIER